MAIGSSLATIHIWSPNHYKGRKYPITKITIHHMAGKLSAETCGNIFLPPSRKASSTYGIGYDAQIGQYVDEADAPWTSSNYDNDNRAITIEVSNSSLGGDWPISDEVMEALINLCVDICKRNPGIGEINFTGDKEGNLTMHKWFTPTVCPGPYLESKFPYIASEINKRLGIGSPEETSPSPEETSPSPLVLYKVQVGAYSKYENALAQAEKLRAAGFDCFITPTSSEVPPGSSTEEEADQSMTDWWDNIQYFRREEFKCKCGKYCNGFPVEPNRVLVQVADRTRKYFGAPIDVSSGVRCKTHNKNVGGAAESRHMSGKGMDFRVRGKTSDQVLAYLQKQPELRYCYAIDGTYVHMDIY